MRTPDIGKPISFAFVYSILHATDSDKRQRSAILPLPDLVEKAALSGVLLFVDHLDFDASNLTQIETTC